MTGFMILIFINIGCKAANPQLLCVRTSLGSTKVYFFFFFFWCAFPGWPGRSPLILWGSSTYRVAQKKVYTCMLQTLTSHKSHFLLTFDGKTYINEKVIHERVYFSVSQPQPAMTTFERPLEMWQVSLIWSSVILVQYGATDFSKARTDLWGFLRALSSTVAHTMQSGGLR